jgi:hypothetical protein
MLYDPIIVSGCYKFILTIFLLLLLVCCMILLLSLAATSLSLHFFRMLLLVVFTLLFPNLIIIVLCQHAPFTNGYDAMIQVLSQHYSNDEAYYIYHT